MNRNTQTLFIVLFAFALSSLESWKKKQLVTITTCSRITETGEPLVIKGYINRSPRGEFLVENPTILNTTHETEIAGIVKIKGKNPHPIGKEVLISGHFSCYFKPRNESERSTLFQPIQWVGHHSKTQTTNIENGQSLKGVIRDYFSNYLDTHLHLFPTTLSLIRAIWMGEMTGVQMLQEFYLETGLLHILALSGQHVLCMVLCLRMLIWLVSRVVSLRIFRPKHLKTILRGLPVICSLILAVTSGGLPTVLRTLSMSISVFFLKTRKLPTTPIQVLSSSAAILLILETDLVQSKSFVLSAFSTAILCLISYSHSFKSGLYQYLWLSFLLPLLSFPLLSYSFGKLPLLAPLTNLLFCWIWELFIIPFGLFIPLFAGLIPYTVFTILISPIETFSQWFISIHSRLDFEQTYRSVVQISFIEFILIETVLVAMYYRLKKTIIR